MSSSGRQERAGRPLDGPGSRGARPDTAEAGPDTAEAGPDSADPGTVYLVGAGPGDPALLTVRAAELIAAADVIFYDRLIPASALDRAGADCELVYVGKTPRLETTTQGEAAEGPSTSQEMIIERLIESARAGRRVVRLKGGDPFVFGRGGEEAAALREAGIPFRVVPGVTAGVAAPAYAGIPVTYRDEARAVAFVTGHAAPGGEIDWPGLAAFPGTLVFYMGVRRLAENCAALIAAGRDPSEPAAVVERGTLPDQRVLRGELRSIAALAEEADVAAPALILIGAVARRGNDLSWFDAGPLSGVSVIVTRASPQAGRTAAALRELGANAIELPTVRIESRIDRPEVGQTVRELSAFDLLTFTSVNGVELFFEALAREGLDARALAGLEVAAIGPSTADSLRRAGLTPDLIPSRAVAESLLELLRQRDLRGRRALIAGAATMRPVLADGLAAAGATVDRLVLYETLPEPITPARLTATLDADFVTLASASAARNLGTILAQAGVTLSGRLVSIGPITSAAAREAGLSVDIEASRHTIDGIIESILKAR